MDSADGAKAPATTAAAAATSEEFKAIAQRAHDAHDVEASKSLHQTKSAVPASDEKHGGFGSANIKSIVFGGLDGIITTFSTISAVAGGDLPVTVIIVLGFANLIADGIAMGIGDGLSSQAEYDFLAVERKREVWEFENHPEGEKQEMVDILCKKGFDKEDAELVIGTMAKPEHKDFFVDYMMVEELDMEVPDDPWGPVKDGAFTFASFLLFGSIPMWVYVFTYAGGYKDHSGVFGISAAATALTLFALGVLQGKVTRQPLLKSGTYMMINGSLAAAAAYALSVGILHIIGNGTGCSVR